MVQLEGVQGGEEESCWTRVEVRNPEKEKRAREEDEVKKVNTLLVKKKKKA